MTGWRRGWSTPPTSSIAPRSKGWPDTSARSSRRSPATRRGASRRRYFPVSTGRGGSGRARQAKVFDQGRIERASSDGPQPVSFAQKRLWFIDRLQPGNPAYNIPLALRLRGRLDADAVERSLEAILGRHEALRTVFPRVDGEPAQAILPAALFVLPRVDR